MLTLMATTLRVTEATRARAAAIAADERTSIGEIVEKALDAYERAAFWRQTRAALSAHPDALAEDTAWERSVRDGLDRD